MRRAICCAGAVVVSLCLMIIIAVRIIIVPEPEQEITPTDVTAITETVVQPMRSLSFEKQPEKYVEPADPMWRVPKDHALLMEWLSRNGGFEERDIAAVCGMVQNEGGNCPPSERKKLVWCVLDRLSHPETAYCGRTLYEQIAYPGQFDPSYVTASYTQEVRDDVEDVLARWILKYMFNYEIERELPEGYVWYTGDEIVTNYFRNVY